MHAVDVASCLRILYTVSTPRRRTRTQRVLAADIHLKWVSYSTLMQQKFLKLLFAIELRLYFGLSLNRFSSQLCVPTNERNQDVLLLATGFKIILSHSLPVNKDIQMYIRSLIPIQS